MPNISIEGPPIKDLDIKRKLVKGLTEVAAEAYGLPVQKIRVVIKENLLENVARGGELLLDIKKAEAEAQEAQEKEE
jgi:4-oxalocrotonate tautomerase